MGRNRDKAREPRGRGVWCEHCDRSIVMAATKCRFCGQRSGKSRAKKPSPLE
jgi:ribosomal protein L40E